MVLVTFPERKVTYELREADDYREDSVVRISTFEFVAERVSNNLLKLF